MINKTTKETKDNQRARKPYFKPILNQIQLVAEEAVLGQCKLGTGVAGFTACQANFENCVVSSAGS
jgi:hypothetical protein